MSARPAAWYLDAFLALGILVLALAIITFGALAEDVLDQDPLVRWDAAMSAWVHSRTTPTGVRVVSALTQLGSSAVTWAIAAAGVPALRRRRVLLTAWAAAFLGAAVLERVLKSTIQRHRPPDDVAYVDSESFSFPSGHALKAFVCYAMLAFVICRLADLQGVRRLLVYVAAAALILTVGWSRVYLGAHYFSDVLGAFTAGVAWLAICLMGVRLGERRWGRATA